jgi:hypothetical protein
VLHDFTREQLAAVTDKLAEELLQTPDINWDDQLYTPRFLLERVFDRVFHWSNGHPYLTQKLAWGATHAIAHQLCCGTDIIPSQCQDLVDRLCERLFTSQRAREQDCHFLWIRKRLADQGWNARQHLELCQCIERRAAANLAGAAEHHCWSSSGIVRIQNNRPEWRNRIYERVFDGPWATNDSKLSAIPMLHSHGWRAGASQEQVTAQSGSWVQDGLFTSIGA